MRKLISCLTVLTMLACLTSGALAAGVTLRTFTPFADMDFAAQAYMDLITDWEAQSGNVVEDYSGIQDEGYMAQLERMIASGEADVVIVPPLSGLTGAQLVSAQELLAAAPDCGARVMPAMTEADGSVLLTPVRLNWEALYVNADVLEANGQKAPQTYEELVTVCAALAQRGVTPIANALCEWAEIALDCAALIGAPADQYGRQASLAGAKDVLTALALVGAFGPDPWNANDMDAEAAFLSGQAAMRFDADGLAQRVDAARQDSVIVVNLAGKDGQPRDAVAGTPGFGLAVTRACWQDDARREAALSLVRALLEKDAAAQLAAGAQGRLGASIADLTAGAQDCVGLLYDLNMDGFDSWAEGVVSGLMGI